MERSTSFNPGKFLWAHLDRLWAGVFMVAMALITVPEKAVRLARAIASDISLYNEDRIRDSIEEDTFFDSLAEELEEGRTLYRSRIDPALDQSTNYYDRALVDVILCSTGHIKSNIW